MKVTAERLPASQVRIEIASDQEEFDQAVERATRRVAAQVTVPGFRRGKAPRGLVVRQVGRAAIVQEANGDLMDDLYRRALDQEDLQPVTRPEVELIAEEPLQFRVAIEVSPVADVTGYEGVRVEPEHFTLSDADVDDYINNMREERSPWVDPPTSRPVREGDQVVVDIAAFEGDQPFDEPTTGATFTLGRDNILPQIRDLIVGATVGEAVERVVTFPETNEGEEPGAMAQGEGTTETGIRDGDALPNDDAETRPESKPEPEPPAMAEGEGTTEAGIQDGKPLENAENADALEAEDALDTDDDGEVRRIPDALLGKTLDYRVTVQSIKEREQLPMDDELAAALGSPRPQTLPQLRADIYRQLRRQRELQARVATINKIMEELRGVAKVEVGPALIQQQTEEDAARQLQQIGGAGLDIRQLFGENSEALQGFLDRIRPESENRLKNTLIAREIAEREGVDVTEDDIHAEVHRLGMSHSVLEDERTVELIEADLRERAIFDRLIALATEGRGLVDDSPESAYAAAAPETGANDAHEDDGDHDHDSDSDDNGAGGTTDVTNERAAQQPETGTETGTPADGEAESLDLAEARAEDPETETAHRSGLPTSVPDAANAGTMGETGDDSPAPTRDENQIPAV